MKYFQAFVTGFQNAMLQLNATATPPEVSRVGVPPIRLSIEVRNVKLVGLGTPEMMYQPSNDGVCVEKYWMKTNAHLAKPCAADVVTVMTLLDKVIRVTLAVTRPSVAAPDEVDAADDAGEHPPCLSQAITS